MNSARIVICGAGEVGSHAAETLAGEGDAVTVIDTAPQKLRHITESLDVRTLEGNAASAEVLKEAGVADADLIIAATDLDEVNLVAASIGRALGAKRSIARVHHSAFLDQKEISYEAHFGINRLICPEYSTATAIARSLRNPAAVAIESFAGGKIDIHEFPVSAGAPALGRPLSEVPLPAGARLASVARGAEVFLPEASTRLERGDRVVLVGNSAIFEEARKQFRQEKFQRRTVVLMGGTPMAVWLSKALRDRAWSIRLFETDRARAEDLAEKLEWVTVLNADPTDKSVFAEERIGLADVFIGLLDDDEDNIVGAVLAKAGGVSESIAVVQRSRYLDLLYHIGVDRSYSPGRVAAQEILQLLDDSPLRLQATLATGIDAYLVRVDPDSEVVGKALRDVKLSPDWVVGAIRRADEVWAPSAEDVMRAADTALVIGRRGQEGALRRLFLNE